MSLLRNTPAPLGVNPQRIPKTIVCAAVENDEAFACDIEYLERGREVYIDIVSDLTESQKETLKYELSACFFNRRIEEINW
jgi:hypothetical protein